MSGAASTTDACPCGIAAFPWVICNQAGLASINYRTGDYVAFRNQLLLALPGETELPAWSPGAQGDLAMQMMEWWAYLADILTFYNERIANEAFLRTAILPESVNHLVQLLGYRPRPALGSSGSLAALLAPGARLPLTLPAGLQVQSKPGPGVPPQVFELSARTSVGAPDSVLANVVVEAPNARLLGSSRDGSGYVWLAGKVSGIKTGERLLLIDAAALTSQTFTDYSWITVNGTSADIDPLGDPVTRVNFSPIAGQINGGATPPAQAANYALLRSSQSAPPWAYPESPPIITASTIDLASVARGLTPGSLLLLDTGIATKSGLVATPVVVQSYAEVVWFVDPTTGDTRETLDATTTAPAPIAFPHASIGFTPSLDADHWNQNAAQVTARWGWTSVGQLVPVLTAGDYAYTGGATALIPAQGAADFPATVASSGATAANIPATTAVMVEDPAGNAASAIATSPTPPVAAASAITLSVDALTPLPAGGLASPIEVFFNQLPVTRGKTVPSEVIGSGNPTVAGQDFTLQQSPVTYFLDEASISGDGFSSSVNISVNGVLWSEARSFFGQPKNAQVFVLREDDQNQTHVIFGDGVNGALLPTGTNNVVASYRYGAGAAAPAPEALTVVLTPQPGLKGVRNPLPPTGGADADPPAKLRTLAPASVLTFNRAVSLDDYTALAATAPGVTQVAAALVFDAAAQRPMVTLWVAGDAGALAAAGGVLAGTAMPNQGWCLRPAIAIAISLTLTYVRDVKVSDTAIRAGLTATLTDPDTGLFGVNVIGIGQAIYDSQIEARCLSVPGVVAIHDLEMVGSPALSPRFMAMFRRLNPGKGVTPKGCTGHRHDPGAGFYFSLPGSPPSLTLNMVTAS